jgi:putative transposase
MDIRKGRSVVYSLHCHLVFVTKYRGKVFTDEHLTWLESMFKSICDQFEVELIEFNGETDHIHLLIHYPPKVCISSLVNSLKGVSSRMFAKKFGRIHKYYYKGVLWSPSYFAGSVGGAPISVLKQYIEQQNRPLTSPT